MYAVVSTGGKQYRVEQGTTLNIERLAAEPGASVTFDHVLIVADGDAVTIGTPTVAGATVSGTVLAEELGPKLIIFKFKQKAKYRRKTGHRQHLTRVRIDSINAAGQEDEKPARARKADAADAADKASVAAEKPARAKKGAAAETPTRAEAKAVKAPAVTAKPKATTAATAATAKPKAATTKAAAAKSADAKPAARRTTKKTTKTTAEKAEE